MVSSIWDDPTSRLNHATNAVLHNDIDTILGLLERYCQLKSRPRAFISPATLTGYASIARRFMAQLGPGELGALTTDRVEVWVSDLQAANLAPLSVRQYLNGVKILCRALVWAGVLAESPVEGLNVQGDPTPPDAKRWALTPERYDHLLEQPARHYPEGDARIARDRAFLALGGSAGLRVSEIAALNRSDVDLNTSTLTVRRGKGRKQRIVPISSDLHRILTAYLYVRHRLNPTSETLIVSVGRRRNPDSRMSVSSFWDVYTGHARSLNLGARYGGTHTLRRTAGTHLYAATKDLLMVAQILGHSSVETAAIYARLDLTTRRDAVEAMERYRGSVNQTSTPRESRGWTQIS